MEQELAFTTLASISNNQLKAVYEKKSDVICNSLPLGCANRSSVTHEECNIGQLPGNET